MALIISATTLGALAQPSFCERCFWLQAQLKDLPFRTPLPGIFSSIDSYVKSVVRSHFDANRQLPNWFPDVGEVIGYETQMHYTKFSVVASKSGVTLRGEPDEVFHLQGGQYHIIDYKTARLSAAQHSLFPCYEVQLNAYAYICAGIGLEPVAGLSLIYLDPNTNLKASPEWLERSDTTLMLGFTPQLKPVDLKPSSFIETYLERAAAIYQLASPPEHSNECKDCSAVAQLFQLIE